jgi:hypothetical protein
MLTSLFLNRNENRIYINDYIRNRLRVYEEVYIYIYIYYLRPIYRKAASKSGGESSETVHKTSHPSGTEILPKLTAHNDWHRKLKAIKSTRGYHKLTVKCLAEVDAADRAHQ